MSIIVEHNFIHFELGVLNDSSEYLCFSISRVNYDEFVNFKKYPYSAENYIDNFNKLGLSVFLNTYNGERNLFVKKPTYFIMNESRVGEIIGGHKLLKFKNNFVDFLR